MSKIEKLYNKLKAHPTPKDIKFSEAHTILTWYGFKQRQPGTGGSHFIYKHECGYKVVIAKKDDIVKRGYIKAIVEAIDHIRGLMLGGDNNEQ